MPDDELAGASLGHGEEVVCVRVLGVYCTVVVSVRGAADLLESAPPDRSDGTAGPADRGVQVSAPAALFEFSG